MGGGELGKRLNVQQTAETSVNDLDLWYDFVKTYLGI